MLDIVALAGHIAPPNPSLFFTRGNADPRMGERVAHGADVPAAARIAIIGVPQHVGVERNGGRIGAAEAPDAIRTALYRLTPFDISFGRSIPQDYIVDLGDVRTDGELEDVHERLTAVVRSVCSAGMIPIVLGGGHDVTYAAATGAASVHGPLGLLNLDAHLDVRQPAPLRNSGTSFRMLIEEGSVVAGNMVEFGIQAFANAESHVRWLVDRGGRIITLEEARSRGFASALGTAALMAGAGGRPVYGTLDMDGVRAADAPGVSAPMPDGFSAHELLATARLLGRRPTVALDIVEVNPRFDRDNITAKLAAFAIMAFASEKVASIES